MYEQPVRGFRVGGLDDVPTLRCADNRPITTEPIRAGIGWRSGLRGVVTSQLRQRLAARKPAGLTVLKVSSDYKLMALCGRIAPGWILNLAG